MTANQKERIQTLVQVCKQKAMPILHKICEYSLIVLRIVVGCVVVLVELLFAISRFLFSRFMELPVRIRAISAGAVALVVVVLMLWPKGRVENDYSDCRSTSQNAIASFNGVAKNMNSGVITHGTLQINHGENITSSSQYSRNSLAKFNGVAKSMNSGRMVKGNHGVSGVGTQYYNPYLPPEYQAYTQAYNVYAQAYAQALEDPSVARAAQIFHDFDRACIQRRLRDSEGRLAELKWEDKMRETQKDLNDIERESTLRGFGVSRNTQQQEVMDKYNLDQLHPGGWMPQYGANPGDPTLFKDEEGKLHRVERDGKHYEFDERAKEWYKVD